MKLQKGIKRNTGITGVDVTISIVIIIIFVSIIAQMFTNISITNKRIQRKTMATNIAIQTIEALKMIEFVALNSSESNPMTVDRINSLTGKKIEIPNGYELVISIENYKNGNVAKIISAQVNYLANKGEENVKIETLVKINEAIDDIKNVVPTVTVPIERADVLIVTANVVDKDQVKSYRFSVDDGKSWTQWQTSDTYRFEGLEPSTTFDIKVEAEYIGDKFASGITTGTTRTAVAEYNSALYTSVQYAVDDVSSTGTVRLLVDHSEEVQIPVEKIITLNLDSKKLSSIGTGSVLTNNGTLIIDGKGKIENVKGGNCIKNMGQLDLKNGTISGGGWTINNRATFNMYGGKIEHTSSDLGCAVYNWGELNVLSGTIISTEHTVVSRGENAQGSIMNTTISTTSTSLSAVLADLMGSLSLVNCNISSSCKAVVVQSQDGTDATIGKEIILYDCSIEGLVYNNATNSLGRIIEVEGFGTGYKVYYYDYDNLATKVQFPTWTEYNGQDDLVTPYIEGEISTRNGSKVFTTTINKSEHNNETGTYITHIYQDSQYKTMFTYDKVK